MKITEALAENKIKMVAERIGKRTDVAEDGWSKTARHWRCSFFGRSEVRPFVVEFSQGSAHTAPPTAEEVMESLLSDCDALDYKFEAWASNLGFDPDSRKAEKTYKACRKSSERLRDFLGQDAFDALRNCERL